MPNAHVLLGPLSMFKRERYDDYICVSMGRVHGKYTQMAVVVEPNSSRDLLTNLMPLLQSELEGIIDELGAKWDGVTIEYEFKVQRNHYAKDYEYLHFADSIRLTDVDNAHEIMIKLTESICDQVLKILERTSKRIDFKDFGIVLENRETTAKFFSVLAENFSHIYVDPPTMEFLKFRCCEIPNQSRVEGKYYAIDMTISCRNRYGFSRNIPFDASRGHVNLDNDLYEFVLNYNGETADINQVNALHSIGYMLQFTSIMYSVVTHYLG